jgi:hypothetical protein
MEPTKNNNIKWIGDMSVADVLCSAGYLPPRNARDVDRFERIYAGRSFATEEHHIDADAIFDRARCVSHAKTGKVRPMATIYDRPGMLRVAETVSKVQDDLVAEEINNLLKDKKD